MTFAGLKLLIGPYMDLLKFFGVLALIVLAWYQWQAYKDRVGDAREALVTASYSRGYEAGLINARAKEQADRDMWHARSQSYEDQLHALRTAKPQPVPRVMCYTPKASAASAPSATVASEPRQADPAGLGGEDARDLGPDLMAYANDVQAMAIQCAEIQRGYMELAR